MPEERAQGVYMRVCLLSGPETPAVHGEGPALFLGVLLHSPLPAPVVDHSIFIPATLGCIPRAGGFSSLNSFFFKDFIYLFIIYRDRERGRDTGRGGSRLHAGSLMRASILGLQDHGLG